MKLGRLREIAEATLMVFGFVHIQVVIHELVHMIDGWTPRVAVCYGWINLNRVGFVVNGDNYTLLNGEPLAYGVNILVGLLFYFLLKSRQASPEGVPAGKKR